MAGWLGLDRHTEEVGPESGALPVLAQGSSARAERRLAEFAWEQGEHDAVSPAPVRVAQV